MVIGQLVGLAAPDSVKFDQATDGKAVLLGFLFLVVELDVTGLQLLAFVDRLVAKTAKVAVQLVTLEADLEDLDGRKQVVAFGNVVGRAFADTLERVLDRLEHGFLGPGVVLEFLTGRSDVDRTDGDLNVKPGVTQDFLDFLVAQLVELDRIGNVAHHDVAVVVAPGIAVAKTDAVYPVKIGGSGDLLQTGVAKVFELRPDLEVLVYLNGLVLDLPLS